MASSKIREQRVALIADAGIYRPQPSSPPNPERRLAATAPTDLRLIRLREVLAISGKSRSSIYESIKKGEFPAPVKLGGRSSAWIRGEVLQWADECIRASRNRIDDCRTSTKQS